MAIIATATVCLSVATAVFHIANAKRPPELVDVYSKLDALREEVRALANATGKRDDSLERATDKNSRAIENMFTGFNDKISELREEKSKLSMLLGNARSRVGG